VVAASGHPACEGDRLSYVLGPEGAEFMRAEHSNPSHRCFR
jgi:hypothetical protein